MSNEITAATNSAYICTVNADTDEGKIAIMTALNGAESLKNHLNEVIELSGIITMEGVRSQSGEICTNNYLLAADGKAYFSQSSGVTRSLMVINQLWGAKFADGGTVNVKCVQQNLGNGHTLNTIVPA